MGLHYQRRLPKLSGNLFTWKGKSGRTELSDIQARYPSADLNRGFYIQGRKGLELFLFEHSVHGPDGEIGGWEFFSPGVGVKVTIYND
mgnify:CR=1 FL=1